MSSVQNILSRRTLPAEKPTAFQKYKDRVEKSFAIRYGLPLNGEEDTLQEAFNNGEKPASVAKSIGEGRSLIKR